MASVTDLFEESQKRIINLSKKKPDLRQLLAKRLEQLAEEIDGLQIVESSPASYGKSNEEEISSAERIKQGFLKFKAEKFVKQPELFNQLKKGQAPKFMMFACSDSRVCPTTILALEPGEAFVVRNVANMIPPWDKSGRSATSAALEYALLYLKVSNILVIGHSRCGGIQALMSDASNSKPWSDFIETWITIGQPARARTLAAIPDADLETQCTHCEKESVNVSLTNLLTFPWVRDALREKRLELHGAHYDFLEGSMEQWTLELKVANAMKI